jgi:hypothetical protein
MAHVESAQRWNVLVRGAEELGVPDWKCEPMKRLLTPKPPVVVEAPP